MIILWGVLNRQLMKKIAVLPANSNHECEDLEGGQGNPNRPKQKKLLQGMIF